MDNRKVVYVDDVIDAIEVYYADRYTLIDNIAELLEKLPSAQPERQIRCGECKHWNEDGMCKVRNEYIFNDDYFCGDAKQKEG